MEGGRAGMEEELKDGEREERLQHIVHSRCLSAHRADIFVEGCLIEPTVEFLGSLGGC